MKKRSKMPKRLYVGGEWVKTGPSPIKFSGPGDYDGAYIRRWLRKVQKSSPFPLPEEYYYDRTCVRNDRQRVAR